MRSPERYTPGAASLLQTTVALVFNDSTISVPRVPGRTGFGCSICAPVTLKSRMFTCTGVPLIVKVAAKGASGLNRGVLRGWSRPGIAEFLDNDGGSAIPHSSLVF